jgi:peptidoglycan-N-acetylglucosamine deacetylase
MKSYRRSVRRLPLAVLFLSVVGAVAAFVVPLARGGAQVATTPGPAAQRGVIEQLIATGAPVYCGGSTGDAVALTFDDGPGRFTSATLDLLHRYGARGTFFDIGRRVVGFPGLVAREAREGLVGDHTWSHPVLTALSTAAARTELTSTKRAISRRGGVPVAWLFRPPYGAYDDRVIAAARSLDMLTVLWSGASDTVSEDPERIAADVVAEARAGSILLLHENRNHGATVAALPDILDAFRAERLRAVTVSELLAVDPPTARQLRTGPYGCGPSILGLSVAGGPRSGGTPVTIEGSGLQLPQHVYFGGRPAQSFTAVSAYEVQAVAPPGTGTVPVTIVTHFGASPVSKLSTFTYD